MRKVILTYGGPATVDGCEVAGVVPVVFVVLAAPVVPDVDVALVVFGVVFVVAVNQDRATNPLLVVLKIIKNIHSPSKTPTSSGALTRGLFLKTSSCRGTSPPTDVTGEW